jgi:hypothetical protein
MSDIRTTRSRITFALPFTVRGIAGEQRPGSYDVETEEAVVQGLLHTVYRRVATILYVPRDGTTSAHLVDPEDLAAAQRADGEPDPSPRGDGKD